MYNKTNVKTIFLSTGLFFIIVGSLFVPALTYVALAFSLLAVLLLNNKGIFCLLIFTYPLAVIFKTSIGTTSFFTVVEIFAVLIISLRTNKFKAPVVVFLIFLVIEVYITSADIVSILKLFNIAMLYYLFTIVYRREDSREYILYFIFGIFLSSLLGCFKEEIPRFLAFYSDLNYEWIGGEEKIRFSGTYNDPNYYSVPIVLGVISTFSALLNKKLKNRFFWLACFLLLFYLGTLTISKSFYIVAFASIVAILLSSDFNRNFIKIIGGLVVIGLIIYTNPFGMLDNIFLRFESNDLTTGRSEIWKNYLMVINSSTRTLFLGAGIDAPYIGKPAHNMYIETVYYIGIIGLILYALLLFVVTVISCRDFKRGIINYIGYICLFSQYAFLCGLTAFEFPFYLIICYIIFNCDYKNNELIVLCGGNKCDINA